MRTVLMLAIVFFMACTQKNESNDDLIISENPDNLVAILDTIWSAEQDPISLRDSLIEIYGAESEEAEVYQKIFRSNHLINIKKIRNILDNYGWPDTVALGQRGNHTLCNVLQHADQETRESYLPMMKQAVLDKKLEARYLVRAEDRLATDRGELQIYGGQMKYYPETKSFNVWPIYDPINIDKRRAAIGLGPIAEHLLNRFKFVWDMEEQIRRSQKFEMERSGLIQ